MTDYFTIGTIINAHGVKGDVRVFPSTDDPQRFKLLKYVNIDKDGKVKRLRIEDVRFHKQFVIVKFADVFDMDAALLLKGAEIKIEPELALPLGDDEYYIRDLLGLRVFVLEGTEEALFGEVSDIIQTGANDVYCVKTQTHGVVLIPAIKDCVLEIDIAAKRMLIHLMDGLI